MFCNKNRETHLGTTPSGAFAVCVRLLRYNVAPVAWIEELSCALVQENPRNTTFIRYNQGSQGWQKERRERLVVGLMGFLL